MSTQELFDAATVIFLRAIALKLPFENAIQDATVQAAIEAGYPLDNVKWAWM